MKNICEWESCSNTGKHKAPAEKDNSRNFKWLCSDHIKLFNKNWNYFDGMSQDEIEKFIKSDLTWHRPTQEFASNDNFFNILWNNALSDKFKIFAIILLSWSFKLSNFFTPVPFTNIFHCIKLLYVLRFYRNNGNFYRKFKEKN